MTRGHCRGEGDEVATAGVGANSTQKPPWALFSPARRGILLCILFLVATSNYFDNYVLSIVLEPIKQEFHVSDTMLGLLTGFCFAFCYILAGLPVAHWADHGNRRTVITIALASWSMLTVACGFKQSFGQLAAARLGIGAVETGGIPPAQSLAADYFPPERRASAAMILLQGGSAVGYLVGIGIGGYVAAKDGWRMAFVAAGIPGILLALIVRLALTEPRCQRGFSGQGRRTESTYNTLRSLARNDAMSLRSLAFPSTRFSPTASPYSPSFMLRTLHATLEQVSVTWGIVMSVASLLGALIGGWVADKLGRRDMASQPAGCEALGAVSLASSQTDHGSRALGHDARRPS